MPRICIHHRQLDVAERDHANGIYALLFIHIYYITIQRDVILGALCWLCVFVCVRVHDYAGISLCGVVCIDFGVIREEKAATQDVYSNACVCCVFSFFFFFSVHLFSFVFGRLSNSPNANHSYYCVRNHEYVFCYCNWRRCLIDTVAAVFTFLGFDNRRSTLDVCDGIVRALALSAVSHKFTLMFPSCCLAWKHSQNNMQCIALAHMVMKWWNNANANIVLSTASMFACVY